MGDPKNEQKPKPSNGTEKQVKLTPEAAFLADIKQNVLLLEKAVTNFEPRYTTRVLRTTSSIRQRFNADLLADALNINFPKDHGHLRMLLEALGKDAPMEIESAAEPSDQLLRDIELYFDYLVIVYLHDTHQYEKGITLSAHAVQKFEKLNQYSLDQISARIFFYFARFYELQNKMAEIRPILLACYRTATLRRHEDSQATLLNCLLRNYLTFNLYDQADKLISKSTFPENVGNNQVARFMYYKGRIQAIQLNYTSSHKYLLQAIRKAPQHPSSAGFQQAAHKLSIIVQLLMGEIPERSIFKQPMIRKSLLPYFYITRAVRVGDLAQFQEALAKYKDVFLKDKTYTLILRLRHNVIKTGVRMISLSYSRISLKDICLRLHLDSEEDAEYIVAKAIRDGVIDASIDHENGFMKSKENIDVYTTNEPQMAFHHRISFCLSLHNDSVKAMRFPMDAHKKELESAEAAREREKELAMEIAEGDLDDDDDMDAEF